MQVVSKADFFHLIGPRDICVSCSIAKNESYFKTRSGVLVGICKYGENEDGDETKEYSIDTSVLPPEIKD